MSTADTSKPDTSKPGESRPGDRKRRTLNRKLTYLLGAVLLVAFAGFSLQSFSNALTPYVSYDEARQAGETRTVQVAGGLVKGSSGYDSDRGLLAFDLRETEGASTIRVEYAGVRPANFEDAISIVAIGRYRSGDQVFHADKLLVKCPSKYQGAEVKEYS